MTSHTPGPWKIEGAGIKAPMIAIELKNGRRVPFRVATCKDGNIAEISANARLIAAAPDLLAALKECVGFCKGHQETPEKVARYHRILSAINKAEGTP